MEFDTFDFHPQVAAGVTAARYITPTPIQAQAIPLVMQGHDIVGLAHTGTNPSERQELALEGCTFHTYLPQKSN